MRKAIDVPAFIFLMVILIISRWAGLFGTSPWKTQEIIYRSLKDKNHRIEFQMQDAGAFGYNRRLAEVKPFFFFEITDEIDTARIDKKEWLRVEENVNELELKGG